MQPLEAEIVHKTKLRKQLKIYFQITRSSNFLKKKKEIPTNEFITHLKFSKHNTNYIKQLRKNAKNCK